MKKGRKHPRFGKGKHVRHIKSIYMSHPDLEWIQKIKLIYIYNFLCSDGDTELLEEAKILLSKYCLLFKSSSWVILLTYQE